MKKITKILSFISVFSILLLPMFSFAQEKSNFVICGTGAKDVPECDFTHLMAVINKVIHFALFDLALPIAAILFAYAGFMLITSGGNTETRQKAIGVFKDVLLGLVIAVAAWLIISTILSILGFDGSWIGF